MAKQEATPEVVTETTADMNENPDDTTETAVKSSFNVMDVPDEWLGFSGDYDLR